MPSPTIIGSRATLLNNLAARITRCAKPANRLGYFQMHKQVLVYAADSRWAAMAERLDELMADGGVRVLKDEAHTHARLLRGPGGAWGFVKRVRTRSWARGLGGAARRSRRPAWL